jgi:hypothetical protein
VPVQLHAHALELGADLVQSAHAELPETEHGLDPAVGRLGGPLALAVFGLALEGLLLGLHGPRALEAQRVPRYGLCLTLASQGNDQFGIYQALRQLAIVSKSYRFCVTVLCPT